MTAAFAHLRTHSYYSLLSAIPSPSDLVAHAADEGHTHLALTDHDRLIGAVKFVQACREAGIQPITGMTVRVMPPTPDWRQTAELVLLARDADGYRSLCRISSALGSENTGGTMPRLAWDLLREHRAGLICIDGGRKGIVEGALRREDRRQAALLVSRLAGIFDGTCALALEPATAGSDVAGELLALADRFGLPGVALQPIYCIVPEEQPRLRLLAAIDCNCRLPEAPPERLPDSGEAARPLHWPDAAAFAEAYRNRPEMLTNTLALAHACGDALPDGRPIWPAPDLAGASNADERLAQLAEAGLADHFTPDRLQPALDRLRRELTAIGDHGFAPVFLVVADIMRFARSRDIPVSTRGSVANSLVAYCTGITTVDPIEHDLIFERFLNPARTSLPDIDLDFCSRRRDEVLEYVRQRYGSDHMALVATISTMQPKSALRETAKAYGVDEKTVTLLLKGLPGRWHPDPQRRRRLDGDAFVDGIDDPHLRSVARSALELVGLPHHLSIHPGGVVVTPGPLTDVAPVQLAPKGFLTTQYEHSDVEALGLPKIDLLGIRALTVLADAAEAVRRHHDSTFRLAQIPLDDEQTGALLAAGETIGVFQCESSGAQRTLRSLQARSVRDLAVANAFFKPGPATGGMAEIFVRRYRGLEKVTYLHPALEPILAPTHGVLIFQEQILRIAVEVAGLDWADAERLRKGMSKFQPAEMDAIRARFVAGCLRPAPAGPGFTQGQVDRLWQQVAAFAGYGFNQGHATAYADVSYRSAYLKAHWPAEFLCARLADWGGFHHQAVYIAEAQRLGIPVRPPHINWSARKFTLTWEGNASMLWMGLDQVRSLRRATQTAIIGARQAHPFQNLRDLLARVNLQRREVTNLIRCGALDGLGTSRAALLEEAADVYRSGSSAQLAFAFTDLTVPQEALVDRLRWERKILGQPVSESPLALIASGARSASLKDLQHQPERQMMVAAVRLPGWTGGKGFFVSDGPTFAVALSPEELPSPRAWEIVHIRGRWLEDERLGGYLRVDAMQSESVL